MINLNCLNILISYPNINVLYRCNGIFDITEREVVHNTFFMANFNYCQLVWHVCDTSSTRKIKEIQKEP